MNRIIRAVASAAAALALTLGAVPVSAPAGAPVRAAAPAYVGAAREAAPHSDEPTTRPPRYRMYISPMTPADLTPSRPLPQMDGIHRWAGAGLGNSYSEC